MAIKCRVPDHSPHTKVSLTDVDPYPQPTLEFHVKNATDSNNGYAFMTWLQTSFPSPHLSDQSNFSPKWSEGGETAQKD